MILIFLAGHRWLQKALASRSDVTGDDATRKATTTSLTASQQISTIDVVAEPRAVVHNPQPQLLRDNG
jgi:hypothetical protein